MKLIEEAQAHARETPHKEICGVVVIFKGRQVYKRCRNVSPTDGSDHFIIDPADIVQAEDMGEIIMIVHSHPNTLPRPSEADRKGIEETGIPWLIVGPHTEEYTITKPSGYRLPLVGRKFTHGIVDCYALIRDYYKDTLNIDLKDFYREDDWWHKGKKLYRENYGVAGFREVPYTDLKVHDVIIMKNGSTEPNHAAIYIGEGKILHHVQGRMSSIDLFSGFWMDRVWKIVRYKDL